jgi:hypothetical protein
VQAIKAAASEGNTAAVDAIREAFGANPRREDDPPDESLIAAALDEERDR